MAQIAPTQMRIERDGKKYSGVYSVSGSLLIARIPGLSSRSGETTGDDAQQVAQRLFDEIIDQADGWAHLPKHR